jgi:macrolide transport system ATP-binding/permease protein
VLGAVAAISLLTGMLFGLAPALESTRVDVMPALKEARNSRPHARFRFSLSHVLVVSQIALSLPMLVGAGLLVRTLSNLQSVQLGFNRENLLVFKLNARMAGHRDPEIAGFYTELQKQFNAIPGVRQASLSNSPLLGEGAWFHTVSPAGQQPNPPVNTHILTVGSGFFSTMQIPILRGREINERDRPGSSPVAIVNEAWAKANFGGQDPLGRHIVFERTPWLESRDIEIVGLAKNARYGDLKEDFPPTVYVPFEQGSYVRVEEMTFALRTAGDPLGYIDSVRGIVHQADPRVPVTNVKTQAGEIDQTLNQEIVFAELCSAFAILALVIACVGLYGTVSYDVAQRTGEIGIRMALGAQRAAVLWMVLRDVIVLSAVGFMISVPAALGASKFIASFLFGMKPNDPVALTMAAAILLGAASTCPRGRRVASIQ